MSEQLSIPETPLAAFRRSAGFQIMFVLHSGLDVGRAVDHLCASAEKFSAAQREWQPVETASKDGTEIVVYGPIFYAWNADRSPDISERRYSCVSRYYAEGERPLTPEGWLFGAPGIQTSIYPTHWMPLPP